MLADRRAGRRRRDRDRSEPDHRRLERLHDRGHDLPDPGPKTLATFALEAAASTPTADVPSVLPEVEWLAVDERTPARRFVLSESMEGDREPEFFINGEKWPDVTHVMVQQGATEIWEIVNEAEMDHPFHLHTHPFQVVSKNGIAEAWPAWRDVVNVRGGETVRLAVPLRDLTGRTVYHCHIVEHEDRGMMGTLDVRTG